MKFSSKTLRMTMRQYQKTKAVCTIVTKSHIAYARSLFSSIRKYNSNLRLFALLADEVEGYFSPELEDFELIELSDLSDKQIAYEMTLYYTAFELCCALRGALHKHMYESNEIDEWLFIDSDCMVFGSLEPLFDELKYNPIVFSGHCGLPCDIKETYRHETGFLRSGILNGGYLALRKDAITAKFIDWLSSRLRYFSFDGSWQPLADDLFVDQKWLPLALLYFPCSKISKKIGGNIGHWNLREFDLKKNEQGLPTVNDEPILFIHFSGLDFENPEQVSRHAPMYSSYKNATWRELSETYILGLINNGLDETKNYPYAFEKTIDGHTMAPYMRMLNYKNIVERDFSPDHELAKTLNETIAALTGVTQKSTQRKPQIRIPLMKRLLVKLNAYKSRK